mgnify:FL=1
MNKRYSNMELLRIIAMLMIIAHHIFAHCINVQLTDLQLITKLGNGWYCHPRFSKKLCMLTVFSPMGQVGNAIFIIISGYFMAHKESIDLTKIAKKLLFQLGFASIVLGIASIYAYQNITEFSIKLLSFNLFNWMSWYVGYYFVVIVIAKIFLNKFLSKIDRNNYVMFMVVLFALVQFSWSTKLISSLAEGLEIVCTGIFLYSLGGYIKKYNPFESIRLWAVIAIIVVMNLMVMGDFYIKTASRILEYDPNSGSGFIQSVPGYANNQILPIILGISTFELFRRMKVPSNRIVNFAGASTFMVYLLHDNEFVYKLWNTQDWLTLLHEDSIQFSFTYAIWILGTFGAGWVCYCIFVIGGKLLNICKPLAIKQPKQASKEKMC